MFYLMTALQKCFFLIGSGANGKSVLIDVLTAIFGDDNVSNVEMSALSEDFQRIKFLDSLLNISSETKTDVKGAEAIFKQLVVGDKVTGCYKGKDFVDFRSRAKMIFACNEIINAKDITYGFLRRICFIKFPVKFTDSPSKENEKLLDIRITEKLLKHKSAIFNWVIEGYKILKSTNSFTVTDDEAQSVQEFQETINPIYVFIKENPIDEEVTNEQALRIIQMVQRNRTQHEIGQGLLRILSRVSLIMLSLKSLMRGFKLASATDEVPQIML